MSGLSVGGFIGIVIVILILNVGGVIGYYKFTEKNPDKAVSVNLDSGLVPKIRYGLLGLILLSWIFSIACTTACTFIEVEQNTKVFLGMGSQYNTNYSGKFYLGLRGAEYGGECTTGDMGEDRIRTAYAFGVINNLLTTAALIGVPLVLFNVIKNAEMATKIWKIMGFLMLASTWCCLFTFYVQQTGACDGINDFVEIECSLGGAGIAQVFNSIFLIGICLLFFILPPPAVESADSNEANKKGKDGEEKKEKAPDEEPTKSKDDSSEEEKEDEETGEKGDFVNAKEED
ncbi:unnamed protein product [Cylindrotheca closterium]|uniref:Uncharacterized protein n=1 Tax=Cylindrotheca closterium TaxID=2856 RepID=A0AAD2G6D1_9STRA|nr:unnamed protein product [Cylindrotheca closterium]